MTITPSSIWKDIDHIRQKSPIVHNITNYVVMNTTANALLAIGASPVMAHAQPEVSDMVNIANALVINIGTLSDPWIKAMSTAGARAKEQNIPIVLDPVGAGATPYRTQTARDIIHDLSPSIIRGNGSEIMALCEEDVATKGVDSGLTSDLAIDSARALNKKFGSVICITGETDYIISGDTLLTDTIPKDTMTCVKNGHAMMPRVTGLGCTATALCGAFAAINPDFHMATAHAMAVMGIAGEIAAQTAKGPGSLQLNFIDSLYQLSQTHIQDYLKL